jgi:hypothetical protein
VTGRRNIIIAISAIVVFAATLGFFITLDVSPQIAYARLFIDAGLVIGLIAVVMAFYRERDLPIDSVVHAINSMKSGKYKTELPAADLGPLSAIATSINELALALEEQHEKQEEIKRNLREELLPSLKPKEPLAFEHSYHPELGEVHTIEDDASSQQIKEHFSIRPKAIENKLSNTLIESRPPQPDTNNPDMGKSVFREHQDLGELYQRFIDAQRLVNLEQIEYPLFLKTIEKTTEDLRSAYKCQGVFFDIVKEAGQVALQPKIIR